MKLVEGPHLYAINGWYYLFLRKAAQYEHQGSVARSRTLDELSFDMPSNPFISTSIPPAPTCKAGHGALVDTPGGEWYYASLCGRPWRHENEPAHGVRGWCTLGRDFGQKVEWDGDGWPYVVGGHGERRYVEAPADAIATEAHGSQPA